MKETLTGYVIFFYRLPLGSIILLMLIGTLCMTRLDLKIGRRRLWHLCLVVLLVLWAGAALFTTILNRDGTADGSFCWLPLHSYRESFTSGNRDILRSNWMNLFLFFPAGGLTEFLLPRKHWPLLGFAAMSLGIELFQCGNLLGLGEIDDVIHNTLGAALGMATVSFFRHISKYLFRTCG